jgi:gliding motility associated protien GldN
MQKAKCLSFGVTFPCYSNYNGMKRLTCIFILGSLFAKAQEHIGVLNNELADPCGGPNNALIINKHPVPEAYNREADMVWNNRIWREVDFKEKINHPLYFPVEPQPCRVSLFQLVCKHVLRGEIIAFSDENFYNPISVNVARNKLVQSEMIIQPVYDEYGNERLDTITAFDSVSIFSRVTKIRMMEDWYLNSGRSCMEVKIVSMAFYEYVEDKEAYKELFWVYFPAVKPFLAKYRVFNPKNTDDYSSFDNLFARRQFSSTIVKESNVYDRYVFEYAKGIDALMESDRIKNDIFKMEHDLWHY